MPGKAAFISAEVLSSLRLPCFVQNIEQVPPPMEKDLLARAFVHAPRRVGIALSPPTSNYSSGNTPFHPEPYFSSRPQLFLSAPTEVKPPAAWNVALPQPPIRSTSPPGGLPLPVRQRHPQLPPRQRRRRGRHLLLEGCGNQR